METIDIKAELVRNRASLSQIARETDSSVGLVSQVVSRRYATSRDATKTRRIQEVVAAKINTPFAKVWPESAEAA